ncbi:MAG: hypothetical protein QM817_09030 [Archangium sp.]
MAKSSITAWSGEGELGLFRDASGVWLHFFGPVESEVARVWPMKAALRGKFVNVTIGARSVPEVQNADGSGVTADGIGRNRGRVLLPKLAKGKYELAVTQGPRTVRYALEVKESEWSTRALGRVDGLRLPVERWRILGDQKLVLARCFAAADVCAAAYDAQLISEAKVEDGGWLDAPSINDGCVLREPEGGFPPLPQGSVLTFVPIAERVDMR